MNLNKSNDEQINYIYIYIYKLKKKKELGNNSRGKEVLEQI